MLKPRKAEFHELGLFHTPDYIDKIEKSSKLTKSELRDLCRLHEIYFHHETFISASFAVGCLLNIVDAVCTSDRGNGFALVRPPGHHAFQNSEGGFCFFNNAGIACQYAKKKFNVKRILLIDWDVHHGNGTQDFFKNDDS